MAKAAAPRISIGEIAVARAIQLAGFVQTDLETGDHAMRRAAFDRTHHGGEPVGGSLRVRIEQGEPSAPPRPRPDIVAGRKAEIAFLSQKDGARRLFANARQRIVARCVVDDDRLEIGECLAGKRCQAAAQIVPAIVVDDDHGDRGRVDDGFALHPLHAIPLRAHCPAPCIQRLRSA